MKNFIVSHKIHCMEYVFLHLIDLYGINVGRYTIHWAFGIHTRFCKNREREKICPFGDNKPLIFKGGLINSTESSERKNETVLYSTVYKLDLTPTKKGKINMLNPKKMRFRRWCSFSIEWFLRFKMSIFRGPCTEQPLTQQQWLKWRVYKASRTFKNMYT